MRDKQTPGDTYNHKEHVYADPVALRKELERDKQEEEAKRKKAAEEKAKLLAATPPPVPSGPRKGTSSSIMYAELGKKTNLQSVRVGDLGSRFGGTVPRPSRRQSEDDPAPPPVPTITDTRNILDSDSPPVSPNEVNRNEGLPSNGSPQSHVPNIDMNIPTADEKEKEQISNDGNAKIATPEDEALAPNNTEDNITEQTESSSNRVKRSEVIIDVKINSDIGFDIGAEIPGLRENETSDESCGIKLMKNVPRDAFTTEESSETVHEVEKPLPAPGTSSAASKVEQGSVDGSAVSSTTSSKTRKKKDVESGIGSVSHQRRNLIIISLFLLILLIIISAVVIFLSGQSWSLNQ